MELLTEQFDSMYLKTKHRITLGWAYRRDIKLLGFIWAGEITDMTAILFKICDLNMWSIKGRAIWGVKKLKHKEDDISIACY